ncbi:MAG: hypothetical protein LBM92_09320 [Opitutaceae bacterium]|nr:hypothetical protein [Opitutaceae bacterium]
MGTPKQEAAGKALGFLETNIPELSKLFTESKRPEGAIELWRDTVGRAGIALHNVHPEPKDELALLKKSLDAKAKYDEAYEALKRAGREVAVQLKNIQKPVFFAAKKLIE